jgi:hypothetical protein
MLDLQKALNKPTNPNSRPNRQVINVKEHLTAIASIIPTKPDVAVTLLDDVIGSLIEIRRTVRSYVPGETLVLPEAPAPKAPEPVREEVEVKPKAEKPKAKKAAEPVVEPAPVAEPAPVVEPVVEAAPEPALPPALDLSAEGK